jgi:hypothetical protein
MMEKLEKKIPMFICKFEKIFSPGWFNLMQHLLVHIPYEAKVGDPAQYRWMYHIKRALKYLRAMVGNKATVEVSIAESFLLKEITYFSSVYFTEEHNVNALIHGSIYSKNQNTTMALWAQRKITTNEG